MDKIGAGMASGKEVLRTTDEEARRLARTLIRAASSASLATLTEGGSPFCSLTSVAVDADGSPVLLVSRLSGHTTNLLADPRCSLLFGRPGKGDPLAHPRMTVLGLAEIVERAGEDGARIRRRFLSRQPKAELYADFPDFLFVRIRPLGASLNGGFGKAYDLATGDLATELAGADELLAAEAEIIAHMNGDHGDAVRLYATRLAGRRDGPWRMVSCDPDGFEIAAGDEMARLEFGERVATSEAARRALIGLARTARMAASADQP